MCGIVCVVSRPAQRQVPLASEVMTSVGRAAELVDKDGGIDIEAVTAHLVAADAMLRGDAGIQLLAGNHELAAAITAALGGVVAFADEEERRIDNLHGSTDEIEVRTTRLSKLRDALWSLGRDRLRTAALVHELAGRGAGASALCGYLSIQQALLAIDRLEVRGRDSAGIAVFVWGADLTDLAKESTARHARSDDPLLTNGSIRVHDTTLMFVYKAAAEIGELGDNTRVIRGTILADDVLRRALSAPGARTTVIGHTRWASVGIISEPNAHPVSSEALDRAAAPLSVAVLNGDIDNHVDLRTRHGLRFADPITTDAKVIPALVDRHRVETDLDESFRRAVSEFEGSVAIALVAADEPHKILLALRGSGQGLCVGLAEDRFVVASEPYGVVEETSNLVHMDGENPVDPARPASRGQLMVLDGGLAGSTTGIEMSSYEGDPIATVATVSADVTTRDIDRGQSPHFLLKEILEAPASLRKTLRGRIDGREGALTVTLGEETFPSRIAEAVRNGDIRRVCIVGQGTAAVAGRSMVPVLDALIDRRLVVESMTATELSGFAMRQDMSDTLVVAVSQSGTTTDTNRTVDLVSGRGASVIAIVNRRGSELARKSDGVMYTSDGRDIEMSVASTKAFYSQVAAGVLLAGAIAEATGEAKTETLDQLLTSLREMPTAMSEVLALRPQIAIAAHRFAPARRYWAVVGNGANTVAAQEVRIKLSELCYKSISCDVTEDKKHIDLSCEPLIIVCATGLGSGTAADVAKEVAIYRAHKALPIVIADTGGDVFDAASAVITVPVVAPALSFILAAMVGHLFGYEAALAIDALARPLREAREAVERVVERGATGDVALDRIHADIAAPADRFVGALHTGQYDGNLEASTAVRIVSLLRTVAGPDPLGDYQRQTGRVASPEGLLDDLVTALTRGIDELTRPIDAIKHQAKTVTVGISRSEEGLADRALVRAVLAAGAARERLTYGSVKVLAALSDAVATVDGFTRYRIEGDAATGDARIAIVDRGGMARDLRSRVDVNDRLVGTKRRVAAEQQVLVARGRSDGRSVILIPEVKGTETTGITLLHVSFHQVLPVATARSVLRGYDNRYDRLVDWVTETEGSFRDDRLAGASIEDLLVLPVSESADLWRSP